jgi:hypothetical protein
MHAGLRWLLNQQQPPITVGARSKAWNVFARTKTGIVGSNPTRDMDVCVYSVFVVSCVGSGFATGWSLAQGVLPTVYKIHSSRLMNLMRNRPEGLIQKTEEEEDQQQPKCEFQWQSQQLIRVGQCFYDPSHIYPCTDIQISWRAPSRIETQYFIVLLSCLGSNQSSYRLPSLTN